MSVSFGPVRSATYVIEIQNMLSKAYCPQTPDGEGDMPWSSNTPPLPNSFDRIDSLVTGEN